MRITNMFSISSVLAAGSRTFLVSALLLILFSGVKAQTIIAVQGFETPAATPVWNYTPTGGVVSGTNSGVPSNQRVRTGINSYQVSAGSGTLDFAAVTTTGFSSVVVTLRISSIANAITFGHSSTDTLRVFTNLDGAGFPVTPDITVTGAAGGNARWGYNATVNASTPAGTPISVSGTDGTDLGTIYSTLRITIPNGTNSVALRIIALNNSTQEIWNVDDVEITGIAPTAALASVNGRVISKSGTLISNALVSALNTQSGVTSYARSNPFGYFRFTGLTTGDFYVLNAQSKEYQFPDPAAFQLFGDLEDIQIIGEGRW